MVSISKYHIDQRLVKVKEKIMPKDDTSFSILEITFYVPQAYITFPRLQNKPHFFDFRDFFFEGEEINSCFFIKSSDG